jgi:hypothetical protein
MNDSSLAEVSIKPETYVLWSEFLGHSLRNVVTHFMILSMQIAVLSTKPQHAI